MLRTIWKIYVVADPNLNDFVGKEIIFDRSNMIFELAVDLDLSSLYPSIIITFNISPDTCYGKLTIKDIEGNDITDMFMDDIMSHDYINFGHKWYGLPDLSEMYNLISEKSTL